MAGMDSTHRSMTMTKYALDGWVSRTKLNAQAVGERIEALRMKHGGQLNAEQIVRDAEDEASPLHPAFEWDDNEAAKMYRLQQARSLLCSVTVVTPPQAEPVRAFVHVRGEHDGGFTSIGEAMRQPDLRKQVLQKALAEARAWQRRYKAYTEFAKVFDALEEVAPAVGVAA